ncbi:MAG: type IV toxin-antitoxin system AbiEi family antitoxin domain-containing protein [Nocardioidaceae bacterium]
MLPELTAIAATQHGVFLRRQAVARGYNDDEIKRFTRSGEWVRLRRGAYCERAIFDACNEDERHTLKTRAVLLVLDGPAAASHQTAAAILPVVHWRVPLDDVHVTRTEIHSGRNVAGVSHHEASLSDRELTEVDGIVVTTLERTPLDLARDSGFVPGLVTADSALHHGADAELMTALANDMTDWCGSRTVRAVVSRADKGAQSVGETLSRIAVVEAGFPAPITQYEVRAGEFLAFVDLLIPEYNLAIEFDGRLKYRRKRDPSDPDIEDGELVWAEKQREDRLRELGYEVVRIIWAEFFGARRAMLLRRIQDGARRSLLRRPAV